MKIYLKPNWSEQFIYGDKSPGFFVGREQEIKTLKNIIKDNSSSAVLIASVRGVGKTSFVHKTLSEIKNIHPIFVNIGYALANADHKKDKDSRKLVLISLIRAIHFNEEFKGDKKLEDLYSRCFGKYTEARGELEEVNSEKKIEFKAEIKANGKTFIQLLSVLLIASGLYHNNLLFRVPIGFFGIIVFFLSFNWKRDWLSKTFGKKLLVIDNSTEYLEIEFENWLRDKKDKKIVFVIDELDKIEEEKSLKAIKEYKNLFNRSFAHFLFISSQKAFDLVNEDREKDAEKGGIFPTLFTHIIFLSLPRSEELKKYLFQIFEDNKVDEAGKKELSDYLLFRSGNDFFELKRHISDFIYFDDDKPFIDIDKIKDGDPVFSSISKLFEYVNQWFLQKNVKELKKHWRDNSSLQKGVFKFLNAHYNRNINENIVPEELKKLITLLIDVGTLRKEEAQGIDGGNTKKIITYQWTGKYNRDVRAPLLEEDKQFISSFKKLIKLANDLDGLPENYKDGKFTDYDLVTKDGDGGTLSGVNLYSFFSDYHDIYNRLQKDSLRISVITEKIKEATKIIDEQINNVSKKYFDIVINILNQLFKDKPDFFINEGINSVNHNINGIFNSFPNFISIVTPEAYQAKAYGKTDQTKYVLIIRNFEDEDHIGDALKVLRNNVNVLIVNIFNGNNFQVSSPKIYTDKIGRKRKNAIFVKNFINFQFSDFRQLSKLLKKIEEHLG